MASFGQLNVHCGPEASALPWLAGLLEAEGSFLKPPPSSPNSPIVVCRMTDLDVIQRVAGLLSVGVVAIDKGRHRTEYSARVKGTPAVRLMEDLRPFMGLRRRAAIDGAVAAWTPPVRRLDIVEAQRIRASFARGETVSALAASASVTRPTIRAVLRNEIHRPRGTHAWRSSLPPLGEGWEGTGVSAQELCWLAGWLEGEGSFLAPPPSDPRRPRVAGVSRDEDVIAEVARLFGVTPTKRTDPRGLEKGWSPLFEALLRGSRAVILMHAIKPLMGARRQAQIDRALERTRAASGATIEDDTHGGEPASTWS